MTARRDTGKWRCKDCKAPFLTYEAAAQHARDVHNRAPRSKELADALGMLDEMEALLLKAARSRKR
jgi:hypothetical protein